MTASDTAPIIARLERILATTYLLTIKTQHFHWNVTGPHFASLHALFEQQYTALAEANDAIAERIRALGSPAPGTAKQFIDAALIAEESSVPAAPAMIEGLLRDYETLCAFMAETLPLASDAQDEGTNDLLTSLLSAFQKTAWMLRSSL